MATEVSICSNALRRLGDDPITSLTDDTERARLCNSFYTDARDAVLRCHPWNFAITRTSLAQLSDTPAYGLKTPDGKYTIASREHFSSNNFLKAKCAFDDPNKTPAGTITAALPPLSIKL